MKTLEMGKKYFSNIHGEQWTVHDTGDCDRKGEETWIAWSVLGGSPVKIWREFDRYGQQLGGSRRLLFSRKIKKIGYTIMRPSRPDETHANHGIGLCGSVFNTEAEAEQWAIQCNAMKTGWAMKMGWKPIKIEWEEEHDL